MYVVMHSDNVSHPIGSAYVYMYVQHSDVEVL